MRSVLSLTLLLTCLAPLAAAEKKSSLGVKAPAFVLRDFRGHETSLADLRGQQAVVVVFLGTECPLARQYASRVSELAAEFAPQQVTVLAIDSNQQDSVTEMASFAERYGLTVPFLKDPGNTVADALGAERTPQAVVLDSQGVIRYSGRIDDQYGFQSGTGYAKSKLKRRDLAEAVTEVLAAKPVSVPETSIKGCLVGRARQPNPNATVTYANQVSRILNKHCVECHRPGQIAPFALLSYDDAAGWAEMIGEVVRDQRMPPWYADPAVGHWRNDRRLSDLEKQQIAEWVEAGAPQGDLAELPEPPAFRDQWELSDPDQVVWMSDEPYAVPAEGVIEYQYFVVDPGFTEDKWVKMAECRPGERSVVHHIIVFLQRPGVEVDPRNGRGESQDMELLHGTAPGMPALRLPEGMAVYVPAGTKFVFQMHYTANGATALDRSSVAINFADPAEVRQAVRTENATNFAFQIPAGASAHPVKSEYKFQRDAQLTWLMPHMHVRGKAFRYELEHPDGHRELLLDVPRYDFNWQLTYEFDQPKSVPAGSTLHCLAHFDNSDENLANPDSSQPVRWGDQTWEEMMIGWFGATTDVGPLAHRAERFDQQLAAGQVELSSRVTRAAKRALVTEQSFANLGRALPALMPQIDRVCVSVVDGDVVRFAKVAQSPALDQPLGGAESTRSADGSRLAQIAQGEVPVVLASLDTAPEADLRTFAARMGSSVHLPIRVDGQAATLNVWSAEADAFSPEAVKLLEQVAAMMSPQP